MPVEQPEIKQLFLPLKLLKHQPKERKVIRND
jgi:hypothetical protein